ncbi:MAG: hypothetical protein N2109_11520 [Fimbriimonadales bacterium]|nr:hypothetical protein [Fimbriimonadales bacterium]
MGALRTLRRLSRWRGCVADLVRDEIRYPGRVSFGQRLRAWRRLWLSESLLEYEPSGRDPRLYLNDWERYVRTPFVNGDAARMLDDKLLFHQVCSPHLRTPEPLGWIWRGRWHGLGGPENDDPRGPLFGGDRGDRFLLRLRTGAGGRAIALLRVADGAVEAHGRRFGPDELDELWARCSDHLLTPFVEQGAYARAIFPDAANTLRVLSLRDPETGRAFLAAAIHRFGTSASAPLDNVGRGGIWCEVDRETGELGPAVTRVLDGRLRFRDDHPETGASIRGVLLPHWEQTTRSLLRLHDALPMVHQVGWDLLLADDGPWLIEGNNYSGVDIFQMFRPLLTDPRVVRFYLRHGVLRRRVPDGAATARSR